MNTQNVFQNSENDYTKIISSILTLQQIEQRVTQKDIAKMTNHSISTIERRLRKMRGEGIISIQRVSSHRWNYQINSLPFEIEQFEPKISSDTPLGSSTSCVDLNSIVPSVGPKSEPSSHSTSGPSTKVDHQDIPCDSKYILALHSGTLFSDAYISYFSFLDNIYNNINLNTFTNKRQSKCTNIDVEISSLILQNIDLNSINNNSINKVETKVTAEGAVEGPGNNEISLGKEEVTDSAAADHHRGVLGPDGPLKEKFEARIKEPIKKPKKSQSQRKLSAQQRAEAQQKRIKKYIDKKPSEYNTNDMHMYFQELWTDAHFSSKCPRWLPKDFKNMKRLIEEQGSSRVAVYLEYVFKYWSTLRYSVKGRPPMGVPSVGIIWGFRVNWMEDALSGNVPSRKQYQGYIPAEWTERGDDGPDDQF